MTVKDLLSDKSKWIKRASARDIFGHDVSPRYEGAICWCLEGAIRKCYQKEEQGSVFSRVSRAILDLYPAMPRLPINFNDDYSTDFQMLRAVVEKAGI